MKEQISSLIRLQGFDKRMSEIVAKMQEGPLRIKKLDEALNASRNRFQEEYNRLETLKRDRHGLEQEIQDLENRIKKSQIKLSNVKSNKEYAAALKEIDDVKRGKLAIEDNVLQYMEEIEELERQSLKHKEDQERLEKESRLEKEEIAREQEALDKEFDELKRQRANFCQTVDQELYQQYIFIKDRKNGIAIGPVTDGVCLTCHLEIPPQIFNQLIKGEILVTCPNCNRLLYWADDEYFKTPVNED